MKIKKYTGDTVQEAMENCKNDLGNSGVILNTRTIREPGILGFFKKNKIEITAAYEEDVKNNELLEVKEDIMDLKNIISEIYVNTNKRDELPESIKKFHRILVKNGVEYNIALKLLKSISKDGKLEDKNEEDVLALLKDNLREIIGKNNPIEVGEKRKSVFFIGPTGVGKTTTLAKIASSLVMEQKYDIGLITSDTYRVGAVDQLKIYSDILELPLEIAYNNIDLNKSFEKFKEKDIVLIDTAGRNYNDEEHIQQMKDILKVKGDNDIFLLISATLDIKLLEKLASIYNFLGNYKIIVTKVDEANDLGSIFNIKYLFDKEIPYYTTGQNVPEDISLIDVDYIVNFLVREM